MRRNTNNWHACALSAIGMLAIATSAWGQGYPALPAPDAGYESGAQPQYPPITNASFAPEAAPDDALAMRVADLEKALKKMGEKEAAAQKKAALKPTVIAGGRLYVDSYTYSQDDESKAAYGNIDNMIHFRTARIFLEGEIFDVVEYKMEMDFVQDVGFKDVYIAINELPLLGRVQIGHFKEPMSLEELTSSRFITFMERSLMNAFIPARNIGVMAINHTENERMTFAVGSFVPTDDNDPDHRNDNGEVSLAMRATALPWYDEATQGRGLLHVGLGYRYEDVDEVVRFRTRPEVGSFIDSTGTSRYIVDTGSIANTAGYNLITPEIAFVYGPFSVQSEYTVAMVNAEDAGVDSTFHGFYVQTSYFLTGEHRRYKRTAGVFDRVKPFENFFFVRTCDGSCGLGKGAWELAYRYSEIDLNDADSGVAGGIAHDHTFGVNWYLNPYTRMMFNYVHSNSDFHGYDAATDVFEMRAQVDF